MFYEGKPSEILALIKRALRNGAYAWPGGYPLYFITEDGDALSFATVREEWREVVSAHLTGWDKCWRVIGCDVNWEDADLYDDHTCERIESAYAEPEND